MSLPLDMQQRLDAAAMQRARTAHTCSWIGVVIIAALLLALLAGCAKQPASRIPVARVITLPAQQAVFQVERHTQSTKVATDATADSITSAIASAANLLKATPPDLRPLVEDLQGKLATAQQQAARASSEAAQSVTAAALAQAELLKVNAQAELAARREAALADERDNAITRAATLREQRDAAMNRNRWLWLTVIVLSSLIGLYVFRKPIARLFGIPIP